MDNSKNKYQAVLTLIKETVNLSVEENEINGNMDLTEIGMDSISFVELITKIEDLYEIEFPEDKLLIENSSTIYKIMETLTLLGV